MNDIGESLPINNVVKHDFWPKSKISSINEKAAAITWSKSITGRRVDFPQADGKLVWGVEVEIPLYYNDVEGVYLEALKEFSLRDKILLTNEEIQELVEPRKNNRFYDGGFYSGFKRTNLPNNIKKIRVLDLSPQEALPKHLRTIQSKADFYHAVYLKLLTTQPSDSLSGKIKQTLGVLINVSPSLLHPPTIDNQRREALDGLFQDVFGGDPKKAKFFEDTLGKSYASEILFVYAHGGHDNIVGEQATGGQIAEKQTPGNWIDLQEVIQRYDDPTKFAAILIASCYSDKQFPPANKIRVFRPKGSNGGLSKIFNTNPVLVSEPKELT